MRNKHARPVADALHKWMLAQWEKVSNGTDTARALDQTLKRWARVCLPPYGNTTISWPSCQGWNLIMTC
ncbi:IS66 family transposase [Halopseudomonas bauzanensis]|uniref:IS66 family transposase n=1 Tax=Halopseudomonas bauzanensis TaxID=653930 RepID=UPI0009433816